MRRRVCYARARRTVVLRDRIAVDGVSIRETATRHCPETESRLGCPVLGVSEITSKTSCAAPALSVRKLFAVGAPGEPFARARRDRSEWGAHVRRSQSRRGALGPRVHSRQFSNRPSPTQARVVPRQARQKGALGRQSGDSLSLPSSIHAGCGGFRITWTESAGRDDRDSGCEHNDEVGRTISDTKASGGRVNVRTLRLAATILLRMMAGVNSTFGL